MASEAIPRRRRCAVYTRKSSEEGLEQDFNSLDAQREACEAYVRSQAGEGWKLVNARYDDGGYSGGTLERPGLKQLLSDIEAGHVETVVVYKVDRLTRSLSDFAKIVDVLDGKGASFVSVTQQFNTTTSMGRLTLNMLLSFAQFEREVTGERIRDKIAASKRKGLWMGGFVPLGYEAAGRTLKVVEAEARIVKKIYQKYLDLGTVSKVKEAVDRLGFRTKTRNSTSKKTSGNRPISRGHLYKILNNPLYAGRIGHKGQVYPGQHPAIIDDDVWEAVQRQLAEQGPPRRTSQNLRDANPLRGKLFDEEGRALSAVHSTKQGRRYRYYVSRADQGSEAEPETGSRAIDLETANMPWRLPAREIEQVVEKAAAKLLSDRSEILRTLRTAKVSEHRHAEVIEFARSASGKPLSRTSRVDLTSTGITVSVDLSLVLGESGIVLRRSVPIQIRRRGVERRLIVLDKDSELASTRVDQTLVKAIVRARGWFDDLATGRVRSLEEIGRREKVSDRYVGALISLAFLAPDIVRSVAAGTQPINLTAQSLLTNLDLPPQWEQQAEKVQLTSRDDPAVSPRIRRRSRTSA